MIPKGIRRPVTRWERALWWAVISALVCLGVFWFAFAGLEALRGRVAVPSSFFLASFLGVVAVLASLATMFYTLRKRRLQERLPGTMMVWFKSHIYLGLIAAGVAVVHVLAVPWTAGLSSGKLTAYVFAILVLSGVAWRVVYRQLPPKVAADVGNLSRKDMRRIQAQSRLALDRIAAGRSDAFQAAVADLIAGVPAAELDSRAAELEPEEAAAWGEAQALAGRLARAKVREHKQAGYARWLQGWRVVHLPLAALFLGMVVVHVADVFGGTRTFHSEPERRFAGSADCASCHSAIVDEWKLSMHRDAQTSTVTVAQTLLALANSPEFGKACVNCHAPIGSAFSQRPVFPVLDPNPGADPQAVQDEGVGCMVCHSMAEHPGELAGFGRLPLGRRGATSMGDVFGPPLSDPPPAPSSAHSSATGFMTDPHASSQLCGACHNVKVDLNGNGLVASEFVDSARSPLPLDSDGDGILDSNELDVEKGRLQDLVLQTTFDEWQNYVAAENAAGSPGLSCVECHMPAARPGPLVERAPVLAQPGDRARRAHSFIGVDYDLNGAYYTQKGMPAGGLERVLEDREQLLSTAAKVSVQVGRPAGGRTKATVTIENLTGHDFPTGFAFARQFFLEVSARTASGREVCLAPDPHGIPSPCASGKLAKVDKELATCDPAIVGKGNADIVFAVAFPEQQCDPWLANFQKILTDGDPDGDGTFTEVAYQSKLPDIVKLRVRTADQQTMAPLPPAQSAAFDYLFDTSKISSEPIAVRAVLRFRHLPPSLLKALDGNYPPGISSRSLLANMTIVDVASNQELGGTRTSPAPQEVGRKIVAQARGALVSFAQAGDGGLVGTGSDQPPVELVPGISLAAQPADYGELPVGGAGKPGSIVVTSTGESDLKIAALSIAGAHPQDFVLVDDGCSQRTLTPGATCSIALRFTPSGPGRRTARVSIKDNAPGSPHEVDLAGNGASPPPATPAGDIRPDPAGFGSLPVGQTGGPLDLRVSSVGSAPLEIDEASLGGANPRDFVVVRQDCIGRTLARGTSCTFSLRFTPGGEGERSARLSLTSNAPVSPSAVLTGRGLGAAIAGSPKPSPAPGIPQPGIVVSPHPVDFGEVSVGTTTQPSAITATSIGAAPLRIASITLSGDNAGEFSLSGDGCSGRSLAPGDSCTIQAAYHPSSTGSHSARVAFRTNVSRNELAVTLQGKAADPDAALALGSSSTEPGGLIEISGKGCTPGAPVDLFVDGLPVLGRLDARADGSFRAIVELPDQIEVGRRRVQAQCGVNLEGTIDLVTSTRSATPAGPLAGTLLVVMLFLLRALTLGRKRGR